MNVLVFRNRHGAAAVWLLPDGDDQDAPESAVLPTEFPDYRTQNMDSKGSEQSWQDWAEYLASQPLLGNWSVQELPDGMDADQALAVVRRQDVLASAFRKPYEAELPS
jgi:hypothetical protein